MDRERMLTEGIPIGSRWLHFKGGTYQVIDDGVLWEPDSTPLVIYKSESTGKKWARPRREFLGKHKDDVLRFEQITASAD